MNPHKSFLDEIEKIATSPEDFNKMISAYKYGIADKDLKPVKDIDSEFSEYRTLSPENFHKLKMGVCWDYVEAQRELYEKNNIPHKVYYLELDNPQQGTHTIVSRETKDGYSWDEASWKPYVGMHHFDTEEELLSDVARKHEDAAFDESGKRYKVKKIYEVAKPEYGLEPWDYMQGIYRDSKRIK
jgi:hypothetical protein